MIWSFSRCHSFEQCPYGWYLNYLLTDERGKPLYPNEQNFYAAFGKLCHEILEKRLMNKLSQEDSLVYYETNFEKVVSGYNIRNKISDKYYKQGRDYFKYLDLTWLKEYKILGIEKKCTFTIEEYNFTGFIDLLIQDKNGEIIIIDHKSRAYPIGKKGYMLKSHLKDHESYKKQLYLYSEQIFKEYNKYPAKLVWNHFRFNEWLEVPFVEDEYLHTKEWVVSIINSICNEKDYSPRFDYFYCNFLCGFRNSCDYKLMER